LEEKVRKKLKIPPEAPDAPEAPVRYASDMNRMIHIAGQRKK